MKRIVYLVVFLVSLVSTKPVAGQHPLILSGDREAQQGNPDGAISYYLDALEKFPFNYPLFKKLGECYRLKGEFEPALNYYEKCMITGKFFKEDSTRYAELLLMNGRLDKALAALEELRRQYPQDPEVTRLLGCCLFARSELEKRGAPPVQVPDQLNSPGKETSLGCSDEGLVISGTRPNRDFLTVDDFTDFGGADFFLARYNQKTKAFDPPSRLSGNLNSPLDEGGFTWSPATGTAFFSRCGPYPGTCRLYAAKKVKNRWTDVQPVQTGSDRYDFRHPALSADGKVIWFASDMPGGSGGRDLWKARVTPSGEIVDAVNAGPAINSARDEDYPSVWGDTLLFFASEGHTGMGGMDIFYTSLNGDLAGEPVNAGYPVNSTYDDFSICPAPGAGGALFCSNRREGEGGSLFFIQQPFFDAGQSRIRPAPEIAPPIAGPPLNPGPAQPPAEKVQIPAPGSLTEVPAGEQPPVKTDESTETAGNSLWYRVQVAAAVKPITSFSQFSKLNDLIDLYGLSVDKSGNHYKYRIGNFESREAAQQVWQKIRDRGFRDCFIVTVE